MLKDYNTIYSTSKLKKTICLIFFQCICLKLMYNLLERVNAYLKKIKKYTENSKLERK